MSSSNIAQESEGTQQIIPSPIGNYEQIENYHRSIESFITVPQQTIEPLISYFNPNILVSQARIFLERSLLALEFETSVGYKIIEVEREPKFVIDLLIAIPNINRNKKFSVLSIIGSMMKDYPQLLFDFRITKNDKIPTEYSKI